MLSLNFWPLHCVILNSSNYVLPHVNDGDRSFSIGETFCKQIMKVRQGLVIACESNYSLSAWVLEGSLRSSQLQPIVLFWIDIMSTAQKVILKWHSGQLVEQVQCCIDQLEWLDNRVNQTSLSTLNSIFNMSFHDTMHTAVWNRSVDKTNTGCYWTVEVIRWNLAELHSQ